jgi:hypothetical protein
LILCDVTKTQFSFLPFAVEHAFRLVVSLEKALCLRPVGAVEYASCAWEKDNGSATPDNCVSVGVHLANVSVLGKAFHITLLLGVVHFLFQRLTGLNIPLVKPKLGVKDDKRLSILH